MSEKLHPSCLWMHWAHAWKAENSWCYRGDGVIMSRGLADVTKGQTFGSGDTVGFKVNLKKKSLTFYKNGVPQGRPLTGIVGNLYPAVSIISGNQISIHQVTSIPSSLKNQSIKLITK
eukprot:TRINITY_DN8687_c1_g2_i3.p3 TRINITY_DN8687_c1_g2~~TRINITY_DN8687_c1_g2_i3.p3  ORF type:complete len:118 (+),score=26.47 TRINITY_DN8687_c1_g2_i3:679-1032(+)